MDDYAAKVMLTWGILVAPVRISSAQLICSQIQSHVMLHHARQTASRQQAPCGSAQAVKDGLHESCQHLKPCLLLICIIGGQLILLLLCPRPP